MRGLFTVDYTTNQVRGQATYRRNVDAVVFANHQDQAVVYQKIGSGQRGGTQYDATCYKVVYRHPETAQCWLDFAGVKS